MPRARFAGRALIVGSVLCVAALAQPASATARDPWYEDLEGHWAEDYVRTLWEEGVTNGYRITERWWVPAKGWRARDHWLFLPGDPALRAQFAMLMVKSFELPPLERDIATFRDVRPGYEAYPGVRGYPYVERAHEQGFFHGEPDRRFHPDRELERDEAVAVLVRALGLEQFARELTGQEITWQLSRFRDWRGVNRSLRAEVALAIKLGIVEGYPDRTLRPSRPLSHAEAATVVYRSCTFRISASPNPFSPDGDGFEDLTTLDTTSLKNRNLKWWTVWIEDRWGTRVRTFHPPEGAPRELVEQAPTLVWNGVADDGALVPPGTYYYSGYVRDRRRQRFYAVRKPLVVEHRALQASVHPSFAQPGGTVEARAITVGGARGVTAAFPERSPKTLKLSADVEPRTWTSTLRVPSDLSEGRYFVRFEASFDGVTRERSVPLDVYVPLPLAGTLTPNPAGPGARVRIDAGAGEFAESVTASTPWHPPFALHKAGSGWNGDFLVPPDAAPGTYDVRLEARARGKRASAVLELTVQGVNLSGLVFTLVD